MAYAAFADAPVDVAVVEVGMGGSWDATNVADGEVAVVTPIALDHERFLGARRRDDRRARRPGSSSPARSPSSAEQAPEAAEVLLRAGRRGRAPRRPRGHRVRRRRSASVAVGGQQLTLQRPRRRSTTTCSCRCSAPTRRTTRPCAARGGRGASSGGGRRRRSIRTSSGPAFADASTRRGGWRWCGAAPPSLVDAAHNPAGAAVPRRRRCEDSFTFTRLVGVVAVLADKDAAGILERARAGARRGRRDPLVVAARRCSPRTSRSSRRRSSASTG